MDTDRALELSGGVESILEQEGRLKLWDCRECGETMAG